MAEMANPTTAVVVVVDGLPYKSRRISSLDRSPPKAGTDQRTAEPGAYTPLQRRSEPSVSTTVAFGVQVALSQPRQSTSQFRTVPSFRSQPQLRPFAIFWLKAMAGSDIYLHLRRNLLWGPLDS